MIALTSWKIGIGWGKCQERAIKNKISSGDGFLEHCGDGSGCMWGMDFRKGDG